MKEAIEAIEERMKGLKVHRIKLFEIANVMHHDVTKNIMNNLIKRTDNEIEFLNTLLRVLKQPA